MGGTRSRRVASKDRPIPACAVILAGGLGAAVGISKIVASSNGSVAGYWEPSPASFRLPGQEQAVGPAGELMTPISDRSGLAGDREGGRDRARELTDTQMATFDVVVPAFQEEAHVAACLDRLQAQDYPREAVRVFVVDAGSTDRTGDLVREWASRDPRILLIDGRGRLNAAQAVNAGIAAGSAPLVARVDAHTTLAPDYLSAAARAFSSVGPDVACVGGQPEQVGETVFGRGLALARRSPFGVGASVYADVRPRAFVDTVQAGVYRRDALHAVGGFATDMLVGEDEELNWRLRQAGYRILLDTSLRFRYATRPTWRAAFRQYRHYGQSRARVVAAHPDFLRPYHLAPSALVAGAAGLAAAAPRSRVARRTLVTGAAAYAGATLAAGVHAARSEPKLAPAVAAGFSALHAGYGVGMLEGAAELAAAALGCGAPAEAVRER
jgi:succinoglycan biosynthesis protein ExoA